MERRNAYNSYRLFAAIIYAFSKHLDGLRKMEESIKSDLQFIYYEIKRLLPM